MKKSILFIIILLVYFLIVPNTYATDVYNTEANQYILGAWKYEATSCADGTQTNCQKTTCYRPGSTCSNGTIIKYAVSDSEEKTFYVIKDDGTNMILVGKDSIAKSIYNDNVNLLADGGPTVAYATLDNVTSSWSNVDYHNYTQGSATVVNSSDSDWYNYSTFDVSDTGTASRKVRLLTAQEAKNLCISTLNSYNTNSCQSWLGETWVENMSGPPLALNSYSGLSNKIIDQVDSNVSMDLRPVISISKNYVSSSDKNSSSDEKNVTLSTSGKSNTNSQTVKVGDTLKTAVVGYIVGFIVLVLGSIVLYKSLKKNNNINIINR